jgi:hypothetical protein
VLGDEAGRCVLAENDDVAVLVGPPAEHVRRVVRAVVERLETCPSARGS